MFALLYHFCNIRHICICNMQIHVMCMYMYVYMDTYMKSLFMWVALLRLHFL